MTGPLSETTTDLRKFGFIIGGFFILLFGFFIPWHSALKVPFWPFITALVFILPAIICPTILRLPYRLWMRFAHVLGKINSTLILTLVFYLFITPIGFLLRIIKPNINYKNQREHVASYINETTDRSIEHMEKPF